MDTTLSRTVTAVWVCVCLAALGGCATAPPHIQKTRYKTQFSSNLDVAISYHGREDGAVVVADLGNRTGHDLRLWLVHIQETDGQNVSRSVRYYEGDKKKHREVFRVPRPVEGITETFYIEVFNNTGQLVLKSDPIVNKPEEGTP